MTDRGIRTLDKIEALAAAYANAAPAAKRAIAVEYVALLGDFLIEQGRGQRVLFPLLDLLEELEQEQSASHSSSEEERRQGCAEASPDVLARVVAAIDVLIAAGFSQEHASQVVARQMLTQRLKLPEGGGDPRGWRRVQIWRQRFLAAGRASPQWAMYVRFKEELHKTFGAKLASAAVRQPIWDRRSTVDRAALAARDRGDQIEKS
jgi:hypothetical protein